MSPTVETAPVPSSGDAADDAVLWVHPRDRSLSTVIATDKDRGIAVYDLAGNVLQFLPDGQLNNVDLRYGFPMGPTRVTLVTSARRGANVLAVYIVDPDTRRLHDVAARPIVLGIGVYGSCMYRSQATGDTYFFVNSKAGEVEQWKLFAAGMRRVDAVRVRAFDVGGQVEGCVADDEAGFFFIGEETLGIWRYGAEPDADSARVQVDRTGAGGNLTADVEGLALYYAGGGAGYLLASSQGNNSYVVYERRPPHRHRLTFRIVDNPGRRIDGVSGTDGIDVMNRDLGPAFPSGVFVAHDGDNPGANQNFKLVPWQEIASKASPPLIVDRTYDACETHCATAAWRYRNGSGVNPSVLFNRSVPRLGSSWEADLDCDGHARSTGHLWAFSRPASMAFGPFGELLVDPSSIRFFALSAGHSGNSIRFSSPVPADMVLCGLEVSVQGLCRGSPGPLLSNAIDMRLGL